jgi:hypothetical protein
MHSRIRSFALWPLLVVSTLVIAPAVSGCSGDDPADGQPADTTSESAIEPEDYRTFKAPSSWPSPWKMPEATGIAGAEGKCGSTALANLLKFLPGEKSPTPAELAELGAKDWIGTAPWTMKDVLHDVGSKRGLSGCGAFILGGSDADAWAWLNGSLRNGSPFVALIDYSFLKLHYVTVVGATEQDVIIMDEGYFKLKKSIFMNAWRHPLEVYRHFVAACDFPKTKYPLFSSSAPWCEKVGKKTVCTPQPRR